MSACFNFEVQSDHFGNSRSLSIKGSSVETLDGANVELTFHSPFSDESKQDACTTNAHVGVLVEILKGNGKLITGSILYDETDGCGNQYYCGTAIYLLIVLVLQYGIVIDRAIGDPGHGKDIVDGLNATDKHFLQGKMCIIGSPEANDGKKRMAAHSMFNRVANSFSNKCAGLCSDEARLCGRKGKKNMQILRMKQI